MFVEYGSIESQVQMCYQQRRKSEKTIQDTGRIQSVRARRYIWLLVVLALVLVCAWGNAYRKVALHKAINPVYWIHRWRGDDMYDARYALLYQGNHALSEVALTFDDGPHNPLDAEILDVLRAHKIHATFFVVGQNVKRWPALARRMYAEGHEVGNHTQSHFDFRLTGLTPQQVRNELVNCDTNVFRATGHRLHLLRPPGMRYNRRVLEVARELRYTVVGQTCTANVSTQVSAEHIVRHIVRRTENGSIILLHDSHAATVAALPRIIETLTAQGYRFVTISEMLAHLPPKVLHRDQ